MLIEDAILALYYDSITDDTSIKSKAQSLGSRLVRWSIQIKILDKIILDGSRDLWPLVQFSGSAWFPSQLNTESILLPMNFLGREIITSHLTGEASFSIHLPPLPRISSSTLKPVLQQHIYKRVPVCSTLHLFQLLGQQGMVSVCNALPKTWLTLEE